VSRAAAPGPRSIAGDDCQSRRSARKPVLVKICGITRQDDAEAAVEAGTDALGFVFWRDSPRFIDPYRARAIVRSLPPFVTTVGVFVNQPAEYVAGVASLVPLAAVQLHGDEPVAYVDRVGRPVIKALTLDVALAMHPGQWPANVTILLDAHDPVRRGGTGRAIDWTAAATVAAKRRVVLAGGLTPDNAAGAVDRVRPFGIDVSSGVERSPGVKDHARLRALFDALSQARGSTVRGLDAGSRGDHGER
jgi:phosphoribosylanthranilate isomerase